MQKAQASHKHLEARVKTLKDLYEDYPNYSHVADAYAHGSFRLRGEIWP